MEQAQGVKVQGQVGVKVVVRGLKGVKPQGIGRVKGVIGGKGYEMERMNQCHKCKRTIKGRMIYAGGYVWHPACYPKHKAKSSGRR